MAQFDANYNPLPEPPGGGSSRVIWLLPLALLVAGGVVGGMYALGRVTPPPADDSPAKVLDQYADAVAKKDWGAAYDLVDAGTRAQWGRYLTTEGAKGPLAKHAELPPRERFVATMNDPEAEEAGKRLVPFRARPVVKSANKVQEMVILSVDVADAPHITTIPMFREDGRWGVGVDNSEPSKQAPGLRGPGGVGPGGGRRQPR